MKSFGQYSIMLCARAGSNTEFLYIGFRFLQPLSASAFRAEAARYKYASVAGSGHGCRSSRIQRYDFPCSCGANECLTSNSATGSSAKSERSLGLEKYLVKMSATFLSPPIFLTTTIPSSILSCAHSVLVSRCLTFPKPFLVAIPFAAEESVDKVMLKSRPMSFAIPVSPGPHTCP